MSASVDITQSAVLTVLGSFISAIIPNIGANVVIGQINYVPEPNANDFIIMTPIGRQRLDYTTDTYQDLYPTGASQQFSQVSTQLTVQCDFHGPNSGDNVQIFTGLFRDEYTTNFFSSQTIAACQPLYTSDPRQTPFIDGEANYEYVWSADAEIQFNPTVTTTQQFAGTLSLSGVIEVDAKFPP